jgi:hypothetical protein
MSCSWPFVALLNCCVLLFSSVAIREPFMRLLNWIKVLFLDDKKPQRSRSLYRNQPKPMICLLVMFLNYRVLLFNSCVLFWFNWWAVTSLFVVLLNCCAHMLTTNSMSRDLRIVSITANPLSKHLVALLKGLLAPQLLVTCCSIDELFLSSLPGSPTRVLCQFSKTLTTKPSCSLPHYSTYGLLHFTRGFIGLFVMLPIVVRSVVG